MKAQWDEGGGRILLAGSRVNYILLCQFCFDAWSVNNSVDEYVNAVGIKWTSVYVCRLLGEFSDCCEDTSTCDGQNFFLPNPTFIRRFSVTRSVTRTRLKHYIRYSILIYRVSKKSFPDYKHLLQENYVEYKHVLFYQYLS